MNFAAEYRCIGEIEVTAIKHLLSTLTKEHWLDDKTIQNSYNSYEKIESIPLVWDEELRHNKPAKRPALSLFSESIRPALIEVADFFESDPRWQKYLSEGRRGYFVRACLIKLKAGDMIAMHQDRGHSFAHSHRIHVPLITNDDVFFQIEGMTLNLLEGEVVEVNNRKQNSVINKSESDMVHLVLDWVVPGEKCCCAERLRPGEECSQVTCSKNDELEETCHCFKNDAIV